MAYLIMNKDLTLALIQRSLGFFEKSILTSIPTMVSGMISYESFMWNARCHTIILSYNPHKRCLLWGEMPREKIPYQENICAFNDFNCSPTNCPSLLYDQNL